MSTASSCMRASISRRSRLSRVELTARARCAQRGIVGQQAGDADDMSVEPAGGVQARRHREAEVGGGRRRSSRRPAASSSAGMPGTQRPARIRSRPCCDQDPIVAVERHHVGDGAERDEVEKLGGASAAAALSRRASAAST